MYKKANLDAYAIAIYELSKDLKVAEDTQKILTALFKILQKDKTFISNLKDTECSKEVKYKYIDDLLKDFKNSELSSRFLKVIVENNAANNLTRILGVYLKMANEHLNVRYAKIYSAFDIEENKLALIKAKLEKDYQCKVDLEHFIDPDVISGFRIKMDSLVIEKSLGSDLNKLKSVLIKKEEV